MSSGSIASGPSREMPEGLVSPPPSNACVTASTFGSSGRSPPWFSLPRPSVSRATLVTGASVGRVWSSAIGVSGGE
jgi:hypothetical protein